MRTALLALSLLVSGAALAAPEAVELAPGAEWASPGCRLAAVRVVSSVAAGTAQIVGVTALDVYTNATETVSETEVLWRRVYTNGAEAVTNTYPAQVAYAPHPPWLVASEGWVTNISSRTVTRRVPTGQVLMLTNSLASVTCSGGLGYAAPEGPGAWLAPGETVSWTGTASGRAILFLER